MLRHLGSRTGFTLMELMAVLIVLAVIARFAYPSFLTQIKKARSEEGSTVLTALYLAQKSYYQDMGSYTGTLTALGVTVPTMQNFNTPTVYASTNSSCGGSSSRQILASTADVNSEYILYAQADGRIVCTPCTGICTQLGFSAW